MKDIEKYFKDFRNELEKVYTNQENCSHDLSCSDANNDYLKFYNYYECFDNEDLRIIFSILHEKLMHYFSIMNERLGYEHYLAKDSRSLKFVIGKVKRLKETLDGTKYKFKIEDSYEKIIDKCDGFLKKSYGSKIPSDMEEIEVLYGDAIFLPDDNMILYCSNTKLELIDEGSYAKVYKYYDDNYDKYFALKKARDDIKEKDLERFKKEFETMKKLSSPYIVEVFKYNDKNNTYNMEHMDCTLLKYMQEEKHPLVCIKRKLILQLLTVFEYIHSETYLHRDISPKNILLKKYPSNTIVLKISDFGLVKDPDMKMTSKNTEFKGCWNDPSLKELGFDKYNKKHEIYSLTRAIRFILNDGNDNDEINNIKDSEIKDFLNKGMNPDINERFKCVTEMKESISKIFSANKKG